MPPDHGPLWLQETSIRSVGPPRAHWHDAHPARQKTQTRNPATWGNAKSHSKTQTREFREGKISVSLGCASLRMPISAPQLPTHYPTPPSHNAKLNPTRNLREDGWWMESRNSPCPEYVEESATNVKRDVR